MIAVKGNTTTARLANEGSAVNIKAKTLFSLMETV
jgi:hypothetical protein